MERRSILVHKDHLQFASTKCFGHGNLEVHGVPHQNIFHCTHTVNSWHLTVTLHCDLTETPENRDNFLQHELCMKFDSWTVVAGVKFDSQTVVTVFFLDACAE